MPASTTFLGLEWARPGGAWALLLPLLVWLLAKRGLGAVPVWSGTLSLWRLAGAHAAPRERRARRLPWTVRLLLLALVTGALALAGPRAPLPEGMRAWSVVVDRSPSMYLPWSTQASRAGTRLERALVEARAALESVGEASDGLVWLCYVDGVAQSESGADLPPEWLLAPRAPQPEPPWGAHDLAGVLWLSDAPLDAEARQAGLALSGGDAVPGLVTQLGTLGIAWDGAALVEQAGESARQRVRLDPRLPPAVLRAAAAWADARGCELNEDLEQDAALEVAVVAGSLEELEQQLGRDGWSWTVRLAAELPQGETWLRAAHDGSPVVAWSPGRIELRAGTFSEPRGDPAAFAVSWSALFDAALLAPSGAVSVGERRAAGEPQRRPPAPPEREAAVPRAWPDAWLASLALALCALALLLRARG